jgi:hypothetical protein
MLLQGYELLKLNTDCELLMVETLRVVHKFSVVVLENSYTRFLSGPPDDPASIHKPDQSSRGSKDSPRISPSTGCSMSPGNKN